MNQSIINIAKQTVLAEQEAVAALLPRIDEQFEKAVTEIYNCSGRAVVSGIGKSAIVAQKIVATFNSTGAPAVFLHAAEAAHGDLGMIQPNDVVIILSKSGESPEIKALAILVKNLGNKIISITGNKNSALAKQSDFVIDCFVNKEACTHNLAPTSSTTVQMVIGDAIAVCLMNLNNFSQNDFAKLHPGGNLGKRLYLKVEDIYKHNSSPKVFADTNLKDIIIEISKGRMGATAVVDKENFLIGIITDGDIRRLLEKTNELTNIHAKDILNSNPKTISPESLAMTALERLKKFDLSQLVVTDNSNNFLGFIHLHDLIKEGIY